MVERACIISTGCKVDMWIGSHISSVLRQTVKVPHYLCVGDPESREIGERYLSWHPGHTTIWRDDLGCALANIWSVLPELSDDTIVCLVDADDWLACDDAIETVLRKYEDPEVWMTVGQFVFWPGGGRGFSAKPPPEVIAANAYRDASWTLSHLKTVRAGLLKRIDVADLKTPDGEWMREVADLAVMFPCAEMSGGRIGYIDKVLYEYGIANPESVHNVVGEKMAHVKRETARIRGKNKYQPLRTRPW